MTGSVCPTLQGQRVLVTGGTGRVGRVLVPALQAEGARVAVLTRDPTQAQTLWPDGAVACRRGDLCDETTLDEALAGIETLFHLASHQPRPDVPDSYNAPGHWAVTAEGTRHLVAAAVTAGVRAIVYVSSVKAMGENAGAGPAPADESTPAQPDSLYGRAKLAAERTVLDAGETHGMHCCILRLPMVYGLGDTGNVARLLEAVARHRFPPWPKVHNRRSAVHVADAVAAAVRCATIDQASGRTYLVTDGNTYSTRWLYEQACIALGRAVPAWAIPLWALRFSATVGTGLERLSGRAMPLTLSALHKLTADALFDGGRIRHELGFEPLRDLRGELQRLSLSQR